MKNLTIQVLSKGQLATYNAYVLSIEALATEGRDPAKICELLVEEMTWLLHQAYNKGVNQPEEPPKGRLDIEEGDLAFFKTCTMGLAMVAAKGRHSTNESKQRLSAEATRLLTVAYKVGAT